MSNFYHYFTQGKQGLPGTPGTPGLDGSKVYGTYLEAWM